MSFFVEYEPFLPQYNVFHFDDVCSVDFITNVVFVRYTFVVSLDLKSLTSSLKNTFLGPDESLLMIVASYLNQYQEEKLPDLLSEHKEVVGQTLGDRKIIICIVVQQKIYLKDSARAYKDCQRMLNAALTRGNQKRSVEVIRQ